MKESKYFEEIVKEIKNVKKYNLKDLMFAKYNKKYKKEFFTFESGHNIVTTVMNYYGILIKDGDSYKDIINNIDVEESEIEEKNTFDENVELSLDEIKRALAILEEKFDLYVDEKIVGGNYGEGSYKTTRFRATEGIDKTIEENRMNESIMFKALYDLDKTAEEKEINELIQEQKRNGFFGNFFKR